jgi:hypothetical protein
MARSAAIFRITNWASHAVDFVLEPWGEIYSMPAKATYEIASMPASAAGLEIEVAPGQITVYAAPESSISVTHDGRELDDSGTPRTKVPSVRGKRATATAKA